MKNIYLMGFLLITAGCLTVHAKSEGYWYDTNGNLVRSGFGKCWRSSSWSIENSLPECEGGVKHEDATVEITPPKDSDGDGVFDANDQCPGTPTSAGIQVDKRGCKIDSNPDSDSDGISDNIDNCPNTASGIIVNDKGCPPDSDSDGVADSYDQCPNSDSRASVTANGCAIDADDDGIADYKDECLGTATETVVNKRGCKLEVSISLENLLFTSGTANLGGNSYSILNSIAKTMLDNEHLRFEAAGHTDSIGNYQQNVKLSQSRADTVRQYLIDQGVSANRLTAKGYGPDKPVSNNSTASGRSQNRRVELVPLR